MNASGRFQRPLPNGCIPAPQQEGESPLKRAGRARSGSATRPAVKSSLSRLRRFKPRNGALALDWRHVADFQMYKLKASSKGSTLQAESLRHNTPAPIRTAVTSAGRSLLSERIFQAIPLREELPFSRAQTLARLKPILDSSAVRQSLHSSVSASPMVPSHC